MYYNILVIEQLEGLLYVLERKVFQFTEEEQQIAHPRIHNLDHIGHVHFDFLLLVQPLYQFEPVSVELV